MPEIRRALFGRTKALERKIDEFLDQVSEGALVYEQGILHYLDKGCDPAMEQKVEQIAEKERRGDELRREIETVLYTEMLIPDARGDVLSLLDDLDHLLDVLKKQMLSLVIEKLDPPAQWHGDLRELVSAVSKAVESTVLAARAYLRDPRSVKDHIHKIGFYEAEADRIGIHLRKEIFDSDLKIYHKVFLRDAVVQIDQIADAAEDVGDRLAIYAVKRSL